MMTNTRADPAPFLSPAAAKQRETPEGYVAPRQQCRNCDGDGWKTVVDYETGRNGRVACKRHSAPDHSGQGVKVAALGKVAITAVEIIDNLKAEMNRMQDGMTRDAKRIADLKVTIAALTDALRKVRSAFDEPDEGWALETIDHAIAEAEKMTGGKG